MSLSPTSRNKANANRNTKIQTIACDCFFVMPFVFSMNIPFLKFRGDLNRQS